MNSVTGGFSVVSLLVVLVTAPPLVFASDAAPDFQHDPVEQLSTRIVATLLLVSITLIVYSLHRVRRGRFAGPSGRRLMFVVVVLLPTFSVATGSVLVFTRAERVDFCASCHRAMQPYVDEMTDPENSGLAALHFKNQYIPSNQCFECHTSYGLFGSFEVKLRGIGDVFQYYTGSYALPIQQLQPYSNGDCLKCHAQSYSWITVGAHSDDDSMVQLYEDTVSCMSCHDSAHHLQSSPDAKNP